jgi:hypothetical protein
MAETVNIGEIAARISKDIFKHFLWGTHQKRDDNFKCTNEMHLGETGKRKLTHPGDVVFFYEDPYLGKRIYLHTDLKSYAADSITPTKLRGALKSLCLTSECANESTEWRMKYSVDETESHEVRGLLFVHNHDSQFNQSFDDVIKKIDLQSLPLASGSLLHYLAPQDIQRLYSIGNDIIRLNYDGILPNVYTFYYPDLVMHRRQGDIWGQPATIESLTGPYIIIKHGATQTNGAGYIIYYNRPGDSAEEFEYFLDSLSRYQMLESNEEIRVRVTHSTANTDLKSIFQMAKKKYAKAWGFDPAREAILENIEIDLVTNVTSTYNPGNVGWRE